MNYLRTLMLGLGVLLVALFSVTIVHAEGEIVTVLFPTAAGSGTYKISADESDPIKSTSEATLSFDLNLLPTTAIVKRVTVQLAGKSVRKDNPQIVTIVPQGSTKFLSQEQFLEKLKQWAEDGLPGLTLVRQERISLWDNWGTLLFLNILMTAEWGPCARRSDLSDQRLGLISPQPNPLILCRAG